MTELERVEIAARRIAVAASGPISYWFQRFADDLAHQNLEVWESRQRDLELWQNPYVGD